MNQYPSLTDDDRADIKRMIADGKSYSEIADWIGCHQRTVAKTARAMGVPSRRCGRVPVAKVVTDEKRAEIAQMLGQGRSYRETAQIIGVHERTIQKHAATMGVRSTYRRQPTNAEMGA